MHSRASHLMGILPPAALYSSSLISSSFARPKSVILTQFGVCTSTFRAARSRCTRRFSSKYALPLAICVHQLRRGLDPILSR
ncbi:hypothetical protein L798_08105 [Zootermopsis nevadensis]|uniref:Uncharacterized protein n=1 Tax=Zootermopsis nevadensis TaxID=136037 RepID=A0A067R466_ZOONE|nr:hypothetical protein L798_08105 [Zootermopsis nevadensis]